jgi:hypothetical protein
LKEKKTEKKTKKTDKKRRESSLASVEQSR